ncbi:MAG TPA: phosphopentomutase [Vicinamibacterales bacterium]|nr:phosphopentomutase [Vicinamibacterales bacterium]
MLIVLDSVGCGELPDASAYGDQGSNTLGNIAREVRLRIPHLRSLGLGRVVDLGKSHDRDRPSAYGRMAESSAGKDSVTGHWEMMGIVLDQAFSTFPHGFPPEIMELFEQRIGRRTLGNVVASGTEIIDRLGGEHIQTGRPIVYTSADSVFQIAAHEDVIPVSELYWICEIAFELVAPLGVGRVIARPFVGSVGAFRRTANRHDYALTPPGDTLLDLLTRQEISVVSIGKVKDLFAGRGIARAISATSDTDGLDHLLEVILEENDGLVFINLVDFDTQFGHRNDVEGYATNLERFDERLADVLGALRAGDLLVITADHGNDPTTPSTDHSREYVPILLTGQRVRANVDLGTRRTFADLGQTLADNFGVGPLANGTSFLEHIVVEHP